ncbi:Spx/MgsR family RNA polymerase-binding regulatory protein [bacterium]|nr:Spx/MgsR family RNA polymerase-binding regulatory protein [bacterium]
MVRIYGYSGCGTCRNAYRFLKERGISFSEIPIREQPPTDAELRLAFKTMGTLSRLFNTSGQDYRGLKMKDRIRTMSIDDAIPLLRENGNLVKRPFVVANGAAWTGFDPRHWESVWPADNAPKMPL